MVVDICYHYAPITDKKKKINGLDDASDIQVQIQKISASLKIKLARTKKIHGGCCIYSHYFKLKKKHFQMEH